jgi:hypothetical protein
MKDAKVPQTLSKKYDDAADAFASSDAKKARVILESIEKSESGFNDGLYDDVSYDGSDRASSFAPYPDPRDSRFNEKLSRKYEFVRYFYSLENESNDVVVGPSVDENDENDDDQGNDDHLNIKDGIIGNDPTDIACDTNHFELTPYQKTLWAYMSPLTPYNNILLVHGTGTGKTCSAITIAEQYSVTNMMMGGPSHKKKHLVICSSSLIPHFKNQIFDPRSPHRCTGDAYTRELPPDMDAESVEKAAARAIHQRWEFMGYQKLVNAFKNLEAVAKTKRGRFQHVFNDLLKETFSDRVIIIDEAHNTRVHGDADTKLLPPCLMRILRVCSNIKLIMLTATPMFNEAREIVFLLNLMLMNDKRPELKEDEMFDAMNEMKDPEKLAAVMRGYVSYQMADNPHTFPSRLYPNANGDVHLWKPIDMKKVCLDIFGQPLSLSENVGIDTDLKLIGCPMRGPQLLAYNERIDSISVSRNKTDDKEVANKKSKKKGLTAKGRTNKMNDGDQNDQQIHVIEQIEQLEEEIDIFGDADFDDDGGGGGEDDVDTRDDTDQDGYGKSVRNNLHALIQVSNVVFPRSDKDNRDFGKSAFHKCFRGKDGYYEYMPDVVHFLDEEHLADYSSKINRIVDYIESSEGIVFVYSSYLYSGLIPLAIALEHRGYNRYTRGVNRSLLHPDYAFGKKNKNNKNNKNQNQNQNNQNQNLKAEYIMLSGHKSIFSIDNEREINALRAQISGIEQYGNQQQQQQPIKVVLASSAATEGFDFKCIREVHILEPWHHFNKLEQAFGRAIRHCSHVLLPKEKRNVTLFQHTSLNESNPKQETIDFRRYRRAWEKNRAIQKVNALLRENSLENALRGDEVQEVKKVPMITSQGNQVVSDTIHKSYSRRITTASTQRNHQSTNLTMDLSTFDPYFISIDVQECKKNIIALFHKHIALSFTQISERARRKRRGVVVEIDEDVLWTALDDMLSSQEAFVRHNVPGYLIYRGDHYIFQPLNMHIRAQLQDRDIKAEVEVEVGVEGGVVDHQAHQAANLQFLLRIPLDYSEKRTKNSNTTKLPLTKSPQTKMQSKSEVFSRNLPHTKNINNNNSQNDQRDWTFADQMRRFGLGEGRLQRYDAKIRKDIRQRFDDFVLDRLEPMDQMKLVRSHLMIRAKAKANSGLKANAKQTTERAMFLPNVIEYDKNIYFILHNSPVKSEDSITLDFMRWDDKTLDFVPCTTESNVINDLLVKRANELNVAWKMRRVLAYMYFYHETPQFKLVYRDNKSLLNKNEEFKTNIGTLCSQMNAGVKKQWRDLLHKSFKVYDEAFVDSELFHRKYKDFVCVDYELFMRLETEDVDVVSYPSGSIENSQITKGNKKEPSPNQQKTKFMRTFERILLVWGLNK